MSQVLFDRPLKSECKSAADWYIFDNATWEESDTLKGLIAARYLDSIKDAKNMS